MVPTTDEPSRELRPDDPFRGPEAPGDGAAPPVRARPTGRATRVIAWMLALGALAWVMDDAASLGLLPPPESMVPWLPSDEHAPAPVSERRIAEATGRLDRMIEARLRPSPTRQAGGGGGGDRTGRPQGPVAGRPPTERSDIDTAIPPIANPCVDGTEKACLRRALDAFYSALRRTALREEGAVTRVVHFGDSLLVEDLITSTVRERLQARFGDAGRGFLFVAKPWDWYRQRTVRTTLSDEWYVNRVTTQHIHDAFYGFGGVSFLARGPGSNATFSTLDDAGGGLPVSRFEVYYLEQPGGGSAKVSVDGGILDTWSMHGPKARSAFRLVEMPDAPHVVTVESLGGGPVRIFGVTLERSVPGVVYDCIGIVGASARALLVPDEAHMADQFAHRRPDLVVLTFGTNESDSEQTMDAYGEKLGTVLRRIGRVAPRASCLVVAPPDRGDPSTRKTRPVIPEIVAAQELAAAGAGCAFWNTFEAMGGENSMRAWYKTEPRRAFGDLTHLSPEGGQVLGDLLAGALLAGFVDYLDRLPAAE